MNENSGAERKLYEPDPGNTGVGKRIIELLFNHYFDR
jgi:hypothetical protein